MVSWEDIGIRIPTVLPDRAEYLRDLVTQVREQTSCSPLVSPQPDDYPSNDRIRRVFGEDIQEDWLLYMEDDVYLASSFGERVPQVLDETDRVAVQFFDLRDGPRGLTTARKPLYSMCCVAVRSDITTEFVEFYYDWIGSVDHDGATDIAFGKYCTELGEPVDVYRPSLVQHRTIPSMYEGRSTARQSPTFEE